MDSNIFFHSECDFILANDTHKKRWIEACIQQEGKECGDINYIFCTDEYLWEKNVQFLDHDTYTDIITFDYCEGNLVQGDLFISVERVQENAQAFEVSFETELDRVMIHGVLHLIGYKDKSEEEEKEMREKENLYLQLLSQLTN
jgi:probable rRNA maturation factor